MRDRTPKMLTFPDWTRGRGNSERTLRLRNVPGTKQCTRNVQTGQYLLRIFTGSRGCPVLYLSRPFGRDRACPERSRRAGILTFDLQFLPRIPTPTLPILQPPLPRLPILPHSGNLKRNYSMGRSPEGSRD